MYIIMLFAVAQSGRVQLKRTGSFYVRFQLQEKSRLTFKPEVRLRLQKIMSAHSKKEWVIPMTKMAERAVNPIRVLSDTLKLTPNPDKDMIYLSAGDPTVFGNLPVPEACEEAIRGSLSKRTFNGYCKATGQTEACQAVANYASTANYTVDAEDVILTSGCCGALELSITGLANPGQTVLAPRPGFHIYKTFAAAHGINVKYYDLLPDKSWEVDLQQLDSLIDDKTAAIVVCNPSNPCGSVFSEEHMRAILDTVARHKVPIIADEIYEHFVFSGVKFHSFASLSQDVPVLTCSGLTKRFLVPGWRMGWVIVDDRHGVFTKVKQGLLKLSQLNRGPTTLVQGALADIFKNTPESFFSDTIKYVERNAETFFHRLSQVPGLKPVKPQGSIYMAVGIDMERYPEFESDIDFTLRMVSEESVFCFPASHFEFPNYFRVVMTIPPEKVTEACDRIQLFCQRHFRPVKFLNVNSQNGS